MPDLNTLSFNFYGLSVSVESDEDGVLEDILLDFSYFAAEPGGEGIFLQLTKNSGFSQSLPMLKSSLHTPRNIVYRDGDTSYTDYFGRALMTHQAEANRFRIYCNDRDLAHEIAYLTRWASAPLPTPHRGSPR